MRKGILLLCAGLMLCVAASSGFAAKGGNNNKGNNGKPQTQVVDISGTLKSVSPNSANKAVGTIVVTVATNTKDSGDAADATIVVTAGTKITIGGETKTLADLVVKKPVSVNLKRTPDGVNTANTITQDKAK